MKISPFKTTLLTLTAALLFTGCATTEDGRTTQAQGTGLGALGGALLGAGIGYATGGTDGLRRGALIGAGTGAVAGYAYGTHVAYKKEKYAKTEDWLDASIARATAQNRDAYAYNSSLKSQLATLQSQVRTAKLAKDTRKLRSLKSTIANIRQKGAANLKTYNNEIAAQKQVVNSAPASESSRASRIRTQTSGLNNNVNGIESTLDRYAALEDQIDV